MKTYVIDASVILTALLGEEEGVAERVKRLFEEVQRKTARVYSSALLALEVANGLRFTLKDERQSREGFATFARLPIAYFPLSPGHVEAILALSYRLRATVYDASYHLLAKLLGGTVLTCDDDYFQKAKGEGSIELVR